MTDQFAIWTPKFDGDAPPNWKAGDWVRMDSDPHHEITWNPNWNTPKKYRVRPEALATPFDVEAWLSQGRANRDKLPDGVAEALGPERGWAVELWADLLAVFNHHTSAERVRCMDLSGLDEQAIDLIKSRCRPINDTVTDEWLQRHAYSIHRAYSQTGCLQAIEKLREALEATQ